MYFDYIYRLVLFGPKSCTNLTIDVHWSFPTLEKRKKGNRIFVHSYTIMLAIAVSFRQAMCVQN